MLNVLILFKILIHIFKTLNAIIVDVEPTLKNVES
jgi:hypothetical protein